MAQTEGGQAAQPQPEARGFFRRLRWRNLLLTVVLGAAILGGVLAYNAFTGENEGAFRSVSVSGAGLGPAPKVGSPAPDFQVTLLDGRAFRLSEQKGKPVWINIWATWCPPCRVEMPDIEKVWQETKGEDLVIIAVDFGESTGAVRSFVQRLGLTFPIGLDPEARVADQYRLVGLPSHYFVDRNGVLREIRIGLLSEATMKKRIELLRSYR